MLPPPYRVFRSFYKMAVNGELWKDISISFLRVIKGFYIAFALAFGLGMIRFLLPGTAKYYEYMVRFFRNVPPLAMIPLLILWCGRRLTAGIYSMRAPNVPPLYFRNPG